MMRAFFPGGWYVEALPSGEYAVLFPHQMDDDALQRGELVVKTRGRIETHRGTIDLPPTDEPLYLRITNVGSFKIAGQAHYSLRTLEWIDGTWHDRPRACGVSPVIYDLFGNLHISNCGPVGSQGYRYVKADDGRIITGDMTYGSPFGLSEWSEYASLYIGQGHSGGGNRVWDGLALREIEAGDCRFIRVRGSHERVADSFWKPGAGAVILQTSVSELRALPILDAPVPNPGTPPPAPPPTPEPNPVANRNVPNHIDTVRAVLRELVHIDPSKDGERGAITTEVARRLNHDNPTAGEWGRKDRDRDPANNNNSDDALTLRYGTSFAIVDILRGLDPGKPREDYANWDTDGRLFEDGENGYFRSVGRTTPPAPLPEPEPPPPAGDLEARVAAIERWIRRAL